MNVVKRSVVNHPYFSLAIVFVLAAVLYAMIVFPQTQAEKYLAKINPADLQKPEIQKIAFDIENASRLTIAQILGGFALLAGLYFTYQNVNVAQRNLRVTEEGKITDRFSKAVEMLGSDKLDVRLGGIYALERIAIDSKKDHWTVMEVLTAFVRKNAPSYAPIKENASDASIKENASDDLNELEAFFNRDFEKEFEDYKKDWDEQIANKLTEDIQAIMTVIGRRKWVDKEKQRLNLNNVDLAHCVLRNVDLSRADLMGSNLHSTRLSGANLNEATLSGANLNGAILFGATFDKTILAGTDLKFNSTLILEQVLTARYFEYAKLSPQLTKELKEWQAKQTAQKQG